YYGIVVDASAVSVELSYIDIAGANSAVTSAAPAQTLALSQAELHHNYTGLTLSGGAPHVEGVIFTDNAVDGLMLEATTSSAAATISNCVFSLNGSHGVYATATVGGKINVQIESSTFYSNISSGLASRAYADTTEVTIALHNSIVAFSGISGIDSAGFDNGVAT